MMNYRIITFGCKLNQAESDKISADLNMVGFKHSSSKADIIILNLCAVTHKAVREGRQKISELRRKYPKAKIIVTGCLVEKDWPGVDLWVENKDKIAEFTLKSFKAMKGLEGNTTYHGIPRPDFIGTRDKPRTRTFIKIQTGCDNYCAYCIVPFMRGRSRSRSVEEIIADIKQKEKQDFKEIVLTGVNIGLYQAQSPKYGLIYLLKEILNRTNIPRIRLGSLWPTHISHELIELYSKNPRLCPHFHLSIQSGSDKILKLMGRNYTSQEILKIIRKCRAKLAKINFTCDIIVGFPSEGDKDFQDTCRLIRQIGFSKVHVFKYSKRPHTRAEKMPAQVPEKIKQERSSKSIKLAEQLALKTKKKFIGQKFQLLWENKKAGYYQGFTENYIRVKKKTRKGEKLENEIEEFKLRPNLLII